MFTFGLPPILYTILPVQVSVGVTSHKIHVLVASSGWNEKYLQLVSNLHSSRHASNDIFPQVFPLPSTVLQSGGLAVPVAHFLFWSDST